MSDVDKLWELQSLLTQLGDREKQMAVKPESFAAIDREFQSANEEMEKLQGLLDALAQERRRVDGELSDQQEMLKKYQGQLMQVKNQQQYAAAWKEIDASRKGVKELEEAVLKNMTEAEGIQAQLDTHRGGFDALKGRYDEAHQEWQHSLGDLRKEADELKKKVKTAEGEVPPRLLAEFHKILRQRGGVAMVRVDRDSCTACRSRVRPALAQSLRRGELVHCEGCHRLLVIEKQAAS